MWVVQHWPIIEFCLLGWVFLSVLVGIICRARDTEARG